MHAALPPLHGQSIRYVPPADPPSLPPPPPPLPMAELRAQHEALPHLPHLPRHQPPPPPPPPQYLEPPRFDLQAAREAVQQRDELWMQQMCDTWRNEQQAQQQLQQDEEEEERQRWHEERELIRRQQRLEEVANHRSRQALEDYEASNHDPPPEPLLNDNQPPPFQPATEHQPPLQPPPPPPVRNSRRNRAPRGNSAYQEPARRHSLGPMTISCPHCQALHFDVEKLSKSRRNDPKFGMCCLTGQINLPPFPAPPLELLHLFDGTSPHTPEFKTNIRRYNAAFAFTSLGAKIDHSVLTGTGPYSFRISGELHHQASALLPPPDHAPSYAQLYIHDPNQQLDYRQANNDNALSRPLMTIIQGALHQSHPYVELYKQAYQIIREKPAEEQQNVVIRLRAERNQDLRRYNLPTANNEVAAIIPGDGSEQYSDHRDIILRLRQGGLRRISHLNPSYSSLHYVLLFPNGEDGWHSQVPAQFGPDGHRRSQHVTQRCYYAYRFHPRPGPQPLLLWGGNLF